MLQTFYVRVPCSPLISGCTPYVLGPKLIKECVPYILDVYEMF